MLSPTSLTAGSSSGSIPIAPPRHESLPPPPLQPRPLRPPIRIIVLCDGTAQQRNWVKTSVNKDAPAAQSGDFFTNVALLAKAICSASAPSTADQNAASGGNGSERPVMPQLVFYQSGVGTSSTFLANLVEQGTGLSLGTKIEEAYSFVCDNYQPGDELFFFGFSRGAYTARCISGMINWCGVLSKIEMTHFADIWGAYQRRDPEKIETDDEAAEILFQATGRYPSHESEQTATSMLTYNLDHDDTLSPQQRNAILQQRQQRCDRRRNKIKPPEIKVVGVWDTVCALGFPGLFQDNAMIDFFSFYDPGLGSNIQYAFHALSIEEDRKDFLPTLWYQPQPTTAQSQAASSREKESIRSAEANSSATHQQVLKQCWFQGVHTDLGGGYQYHGLSDISLIWMASQLVDPHRQPDGSMTSGNLLNIDLELLKSVLDQRRSWGCQIPHRSRPTINFQHGRIVHQRRFDPSSMKRTVWANMSQGSRTFESIHPSVVVGGRIDKNTHKAFAELRTDNPDKFNEMWAAAEDFEGTMRPTELALYWKQPGPYPSPMIDPRNPRNPHQGGWNIALPDENPYADYPLRPNAVDGYIDENLESQRTRLVPSQELGENPVDKSRHPKFESVWRSVYNAAALPNLAVVNALNLRAVPRDNLNPTALQNAWWKVGDKYMGYSSQYKDMFRGYSV